MFEQCCVTCFMQIIGKTRVTITLSTSMSDFDYVQIVNHVIYGISSSILSNCKHILKMPHNKFYSRLLKQIMIISSLCLQTGHQTSTMEILQQTYLQCYSCRYTSLYQRCRCCSGIAYGHVRHLRPDETWYLRWFVCFWLLRQENCKTLFLVNRFASASSFFFLRWKRKQR